MRKKASLHQTHELPRLQTAPARRLHETRHLALSWSPTVPPGASVDVCLHVFKCSSVLGQEVGTLREQVVLIFISHFKCPTTGSAVGQCLCPSHMVLIFSFILVFGVSSLISQHYLTTHVQYVTLLLSGI